jgi:uncharacterized protein YdbL (DUF1318 family)
MTIRMQTNLKSLASLAMAMVVASVACAAETGIVPAEPQTSGDTKAELKVRFEKRYPQLAKLLDQGKVGETWKGYVEAVKSERDLEPDARELIQNENADRKRLYELIAADSSDRQRRLTSEQVGERNAWRKFTDARPNWYLKSREGPWIQRSDVDRLKREGKIGEQWDGFVGAVKSEFTKEPRVNAVINVENRVRKYKYERRAAEAEDEQDGGKRTERDAAAEAERAGSQNIDRARPGEYIKRKGGDWEKKG